MAGRGWLGEGRRAPWDRWAVITISDRLETVGPFEVGRVYRARRRSAARVAHALDEFQMPLGAEWTTTVFRAKDAPAPPVPHPHVVLARMEIEHLWMMSRSARRQLLLKKILVAVVLGGSWGWLVNYFFASFFVVDLILMVGGGYMIGRFVGSWKPLGLRSYPSNGLAVSSRPSCLSSHHRPRTVMPTAVWFR